MSITAVFGVATVFLVAGLLHAHRRGAHLPRLLGGRPRRTDVQARLALARHVARPGRLPVGSAVLFGIRCCRALLYANRVRRVRLGTIANVGAHCGALDYFRLDRARRAGASVCRVLGHRGYVDSSGQRLLFRRLPLDNSSNMERILFHAVRLFVCCCASYFLLGRR